jgi:hypothetical protein
MAENSKEHGTMNTEDVIRKAAKLHAHAVNAKAMGSEAEANNYAAAMQKLLATYKLSMSDVDFDQHLKTEPVGKSRVRWEDHGFKTKWKRQSWIEDLAFVVCPVFGCKFLVSPGTNIITLVGRESSRKVCEYTLAVLVREAAKIAEKEYYKHYDALYAQGLQYQAKGFKAAFLTGFTNRIKQRFEAEMKGEAESGTAIVRFKIEVAEAEAWCDENVKGKASALSREKSWNSAGYQRGAEVANSLDLKGKALERDKPVTSSKRLA